MGLVGHRSTHLREGPELGVFFISCPGEQPGGTLTGFPVCNRMRLIRLCPASLGMSCGRALALGGACAISSMPWLVPLAALRRPPAGENWRGVALFSPQALLDNLAGLNVTRECFVQVDRRKQERPPSS